MRKIKSDVVIVLILMCFYLVLATVFFTVLLNGKAILNAIKVVRAPADWAFEASSIELNNKIIEKYPQLDPDKTGYITKSAANAMTEDLIVHDDIFPPNGEYGKINSTLKGIENFTNVKVLSVSLNGLSGEIPTAIGNLSNLKDLSLGCDFIASYINHNQLSGEIPATIGNLTNLEYLNLYHNQLSGEIPSTIGNLTKLKTLYLSDNQLSREIPATIGNLTNLETLYLSDNQLSGEIPATIGNLTNLKFLELQNNQLSGKVPSTIIGREHIKKFMHLNLNKNHLSGEVPSIGVP